VNRFVCRGAPADTLQQTSIQQKSSRLVLKKVPVNQLAVGMYLHALEGNWLDHPFWRNGFLIQDARTLQKVLESGVQHCFIDVAQGADTPAQPAPAPVRASEPTPPPAPKRERVSLADEIEYATRLRTRSAQAMRDLFSEARMGKAIDAGACSSLVEDVAASIDRHPDAFRSLTRLKTADEYTYMHSVAVCALMVSLGRQLGLDDAQCREAGLAGMLHDVGKALMPQDVLNKPGKLTPEEFDIIKTHPRRGYELLLSAKNIPAGALDVCLHHHERYDGTGYPERQAAENISQVSRMGAICDVYDAVTSNRPYKAGWDPAFAITQMASWQGHFDREIFRSFVRCIGIYPTGSLVRMRSGRLAVVLEPNAEALTKPRVKLFFSTKSGEPIKPEVVDLATDARDQIEGPESPEKWRFPYLEELWAGPK
jgi:HD-GYP domain-containing protein (c-di-GMP phosphodiesterase class II)